MPCYHPLTAYQCANGDVVFVERQRHDIVKTLALPCGQCIGCRLERSRQWALRCLHEAKMHPANAFVTLTYDDENVPKRKQLVYDDYQRFMKRLRKAIEVPVRFYMCGEYGDENGRPHFHACLFGYGFPDKVPLGLHALEQPLYRSEFLERLWPMGISSIGEVTFQSAAYAARYCVQKRTGEAAKEWYKRVDELGAYELVPEFNKMSLKPGIGAEFYKKWRTDIYPNDYVVHDGTRMKPPKFYDLLYKRENKEEFEEIKYNRESSARERYEDNTERRLKDKEVVELARSNMLIRGLKNYA